MTLRLPAIDGLDTEVGLEATGGDRALYLRLLARFVELHQGDAASWPALLAAGDAALAIRQVHRLRGAAATLGLTRVTESTARFEQCLREQGAGAATVVHMVDAQVELDRALRALRAVLPAGPVK